MTFPDVTATVRRSPLASFAIVLSCAALAMQFDVPALAARLITGAQIKNHSVTGVDIAARTLTTSHVRNGSLRAIDFATGQIPAGPRGLQGVPGLNGDPTYTRTTVVSPGSTQAAGGAALLAAVAAVPTLAAGDRWLIWLEPGSYELPADTALVLPARVSLMGSGSYQTSITGSKVGSSTASVVVGGGQLSNLSVNTSIDVGDSIGVRTNGTSTLFEVVINTNANDAGALAEGLHIAGPTTVVGGTILAAATVSYGIRTTAGGLDLHGSVIYADGGAGVGIAHTTNQRISVTDTDITPTSGIGIFSSGGGIVEARSVGIYDINGGNSVKATGVNSQVRVTGSQLDGVPAMSGGGVVTCGASVNASLAAVLSNCA